MSDLQIVDVVSMVNNSPKDMALPGTSKEKNSEKTPKRNEKDAGKPLLQLIKHLVNFVDNEGKTILTNSQLMDILNREFNIDIWKSHSLEVEIYMNILKKFLKSWPRWDAVDLYVQKAKSDKSINIENILSEEYEGLKKYLKEMLDLSKEPTEATMKKVCTVDTKSKTTGVLEVSCTRSQLKRLFYQRPEPQKLNTIFHVSPEATPSKISLTTLNFSQILNWPHINIYVESTFFEYTHKNVHPTRLTLINNKLGYKPPIPEICQDVLYKPKHMNLQSNNLAPFEKSYVLVFFEQLSEALLDNVTIYADLLRHLISVITYDIMHTPDKVERCGIYKYYLNKYPYVRYFSEPTPMTEVPENVTEMGDYNLELEEYILPCSTFSLPFIFSNFTETDGSYKFKFNKKNIDMFLDDSARWLRIECTYCNCSFRSLSRMWHLKQHVMEKHCDDPDLQCSNCKKSFSQAYLASHNWWHSC